MGPNRKTQNAANKKDKNRATSKLVQINNNEKMIAILAIAISGNNLGKIFSSNLL